MILDSSPCNIIVFIESSDKWFLQYSHTSFSFISLFSRIPSLTSASLLSSSLSSSISSPSSGFSLLNWSSNSDKSLPIIFHIFLPIIGCSDFLVSFFCLFFTNSSILKPYFFWKYPVRIPSSANLLLYNSSNLLTNEISNGLPVSGLLISSSIISCVYSSFTVKQ